jgi:chemotaxis protein MotA
MAGGHVAAIWQPSEMVIICGAALGAFIASNGTKQLKLTLKALPTLLKGSKYTKLLYMELMAMMSEILTKVRKEGLMSIENDVEEPEQSPIFSKYSSVMADHHLMEFLTDYLRLMVSGNMDVFQIENLMDHEIETHHQEGHIPVDSISKVADAMPAFGIVAAVMGVVHTMESVHLPPAQLGMLVAAALVGTFLGILISYGFVAPIASSLEQRLNESSKMLECVKVTLLASLNGYAPQLAIEFGRKVLFSTERPSFAELEEYVKQSRSR